MTFIHICAVPAQHWKLHQKTREMCLFSQGDKKNFIFISFQDSWEGIIGYTAVHTLQVLPSFATDAFLCACTALELSLLQNLDHSSHAFMCPTRFVAHMFTIPINCCRRMTTFLLTRVVRYQGRKKVEEWCLLFVRGPGNENKLLLQSTCWP